MKNCTILSRKTPINDLLTVNYGHPSSCTTIRTWRTTKAHFGPLMKLNARWALPVYPVLKDQSHWKMCEHILKNTQRTNTIQVLWIVKNQENANNSPSYRCAAIKKSKQVNSGHQQKNSRKLSGCFKSTHLTCPFFLFNRRDLSPQPDSDQKL